MRIEELTAYHVRIPLRKTIRHASHTRTDTDSLIVRCRLDDGTLGWGEGLPRSYVTGETIATALEQLRTTGLQPQLGEAFDDLPAAISLSDRIRLTVPQNSADERGCFGNSVRCALELSILDAAARTMQVPLSRVTQLVPETAAIRQQAERVRYSAAITSMSPFEQRIQAWKIRMYGFHQTKVKVGTDGIDDRSTLKRVRGILGPKADLRLDANEAWTCKNLEEKMLPLVPFEITSLEQPVPHAQVDGLAAVKRNIPVPIMLDESLCSLADGRKAIERDTCGLFNIRLSKCGGFVKSLRLAALAHQAGLGYQLGCQVGETGILSAAGRHFACAVAGIRYLEGSYDWFLVKERLTVANMTFGYRGFAPALTQPGLGVEIDSKALERVTIAEEHFQIASKIKDAL